MHGAWELLLLLAWIPRMARGHLLLGLTSGCGGLPEVGQDVVYLFLWLLLFLILYKRTIESACEPLQYVAHSSLPAAQHVFAAVTPDSGQYGVLSLKAEQKPCCVCSCSRTGCRNKIILRHGSRHGMPSLQRSQAIQPRGWRRQGPRKQHRDSTPPSGACRRGS